MARALPRVRQVLSGRLVSSKVVNAATRCGLTSYPRAIPCRSCDACAERLPPVRLADLLHSTREMRRSTKSLSDSIREQAFVASSFALVELKKIGFSLDNTSK
jgi:hypothetical protein